MEKQALGQILSLDLGLGKIPDTVGNPLQTELACRPD